MQDTDGIQAGEASARGDGERGTLTKMPQRDHAAHGCGSGVRRSCDLSTSAAGDGHREGQSPECSNKLVVLTGGKGKKNGQQERKKDIATTHQRQNRGVMGVGHRRDSSQRGVSKRWALTEMPQQDSAAYGRGSGARHSCDLSTSATGNGHREGQSPECSNKLAVLTGGKGKKKWPAREKEGHSNNAPATK